MELLYLYVWIYVKNRPLRGISERVGRVWLSLDGIKETCIGLSIVTIHMGNKLVPQNLAEREAYKRRNNTEEIALISRRG
jgi:hypothetical protein